MQKNYSSTFLRAIPGQMEGFGSPGIVTRKNSALDVYWSNTIATPATVDNSTSYSVALTGGDLGTTTVTVTVTTPSSATQGGLNSLLLAAIRDSGIHDVAVSSLASNTITLKARRLGQNYTLTSPSNASTTNDLTIGTQVATASSSTVPFGRFVVRSTSGTVDALDEARLPTTASNVLVQGVTLAPRAAVIKDAIGPMAQAAYYKNEAMDVYVRSNDGVGIWVEADTGITAATALSALYIDCNTAGKLGRVTLTTTSNLQLPGGIGLVEGSTQSLNGIYVVLLSLNLPA